MQGFRNGLTREGHASRGHEVEDTSECVEVRAEVDGFLAELFGRYCVDDTLKAAIRINGLGTRAKRVLGDAEIEEFDVEGSAGEFHDYDVRWLEVALKRSKRYGFFEEGVGGRLLQFGGGAEALESDETIELGIPSAINHAHTAFTEGKRVFDYVAVRLG